MKRFLQACLLGVALVATSPVMASDCVPLYSANIIEVDTGRALQVFVHAKSSIDARRILESTYGRGRVLGIRQESYC